MEESLLDTARGGESNQLESGVCLCERIRMQACPLAELSMRVIYEHVHALGGENLCMQRWTWA